MNILFIGGPHEALPGFGQAKAAGYNVYVTDGDPGAPGVRWAKKYGAGWGVAPSTYDADHTINIARRFAPIDGVVALSCDVGPVVSRVANALGLPHVPYETALLGWDKQALRLKLREAGIRVPSGFEVPEGRTHLMTPQDNVLIVKPVGGRGGRGVKLVRTTEELLEAIKEGQNLSPQETAIVEHFVDGPQVSAEALVWDSKVTFCGLTDRDYRLEQTYPYPVEFGGWGPSRWEGTVVGLETKKTVGKVVETLGIKAGTIKLDVVLDSSRLLEPVIIEAAIGRMSGGYSATHYWPLCYGVQFVRAACDIACGVDPRPFGKIGLEKRCRGIYRAAGEATSNPERGRFKMGVGKTRIEAERKVL